MEFASLEQLVTNIPYNDGNVAIIDNLHQFTNAEAIRMGIHAALLCEKGQLGLDINGKSMTVFEDEILFCPVSGIIDKLMPDNNFNCKILCLTDGILNEFLGSLPVIHKAMYVDKINIIPLDNNTKNMFLGYYDIARRYMADANAPFHKQMMHALVQSFLFFLCSYVMKFLPSDDKMNTNYAEKIFQRFLSLMAQEQQKRHPIDYYADKLCITPKYLTIICNRISGKPASDWIRDYTLAEIRHFLRNTDKPVKEIASLLGFPSVQSFGKYVRLNMGMSPKEYRRCLSAHQ